VRARPRRGGRFPSRGWVPACCKVPATLNQLPLPRPAGECGRQTPLRGTDRIRGELRRLDPDALPVKPRSKIAPPVGGLETNHGDLEARDAVADGQDFPGRRGVEAGQLSQHADRRRLVRFAFLQRAVGKLPQVRPAPPSTLTPRAPAPPAPPCPPLGGALPPARVPPPAGQAGGRRSGPPAGRRRSAAQPPYTPARPTPSAPG